MIQELGIGEMKFTAHAAESEIARAENQTPDSGRHQRSGAHHARFQRSVERGGFQTVVAQSGARFTQRENFGVRGGVPLRDRRIEATSDDLAIDHYYGAHRHFATRFGLTRQGQSFAHEYIVSLKQFLRARHLWWS